MKGLLVIVVEYDNEQNIRLSHDLFTLVVDRGGPQLLLSIVVFLDRWYPEIRNFCSVIPVDVARGVACLMWMASLTLRLYSNMSLDQITLPCVKVDGG